MNRYDCDTTRDLLPVLVRDALLPHEAAAAESHLESCAACREEAAIAGLLYHYRPAVPAGLEARVLLAVRQPVPARRWSPGRLAMAATVAAALLGGSLVLERMGMLRGPSADSVTLVDIGAASTFSWAAAEDPLLHGSSRLQELSVEELELLLAELES